MRLKPATITSFLILATFAIAGPTLVLWTAGYRWDTRTNRLEATGIIVVDSVPKGASIRIGDEERAETTPARITGLLPREYALTVSLPGYKSWTQKVSVEGGKSTFAEKIRLFPDRLPESVLDKPVAKLAISPDLGTIAAATVADGTVEIWTVDATSGQATLSQRLSGDGVERLEWSPTGAGLLAVTSEGGKRSAEIVSGDSRTDLKLPSEGPLALGWSQDDPTKLVAKEEDEDLTRVWLVPASGASPTMIWSASSTGYGLTGTPPILEGNLLLTTDVMATTTAIVTTRPGEASTGAIAELPGGPYELLPSPADRLTLLNPIRSRITVADRASRATVAEVPGKETAWTDRGDEAMLAWDEVELSLVSPTGKVSTLARLSGDIRSAAWLPDATYVLLLTEGSLRAIEREPQDGTRTTTQIASLSGATAMVVTTDSVYVAATVGTKPGLYRLGLTPTVQ